MIAPAVRPTSTSRTYLWRKYPCASGLLTSIYHSPIGQGSGKALRIGNLLHPPIDILGSLLGAKCSYLGSHDLILVLVGWGYTLGFPPVFVHTFRTFSHGS